MICSMEEVIDVEQMKAKITYWIMKISYTMWQLLQEIKIEQNEK